VKVSVASFVADAVWAKAQSVEGYNPNVIRKDFFGAWIKKSAYGKIEEFG
jgi:hypothetical protein